MWNGLHWTDKEILRLQAAREDQPVAERAIVQAPDVLAQPLGTRHYCMHDYLMPTGDKESLISEEDFLCFALLASEFQTLKFYNHNEHEQ